MKCQSRIKTATALLCCTQNPIVTQVLLSRREATKPPRPAHLTAPLDRLTQLYHGSSAHSAVNSVAHSPRLRLRHAFAPTRRADEVSAYSSFLLLLLLLLPVCHLSGWILGHATSPCSITFGATVVKHARLIA